jgi:hypothetical protein
VGADDRSLLAATATAEEGVGLSPILSGPILGGIHQFDSGVAAFTASQLTAGGTGQEADPAGPVDDAEDAAVGLGRGPSDQIDETVGEEPGPGIVPATIDDLEGRPSEALGLT